VVRLVPSPLRGFASLREPSSSFPPARSSWLVAWMRVEGRVPRACPERSRRVEGGRETEIEDEIEIDGSGLAASLPRH